MKTAGRDLNLTPDEVEKLAVTFQCILPDNYKKKKKSDFSSFIVRLSEVWHQSSSVKNIKNNETWFRPQTELYNWNCFTFLKIEKVKLNINVPLKKNKWIKKQTTWQ